MISLSAAATSASPYMASLVLAAVTVGFTDIGPSTVALFYLAAITPPLCVSDLRLRRLPNRLVVPSYLVLVVALGLQWIVSGVAPVIALASGFGYFALMLLLSIAGGMGMGDVKLAGSLGLAAGMVGLEAALLAPMAAFLTGGVAAAIALLAARGRNGTRIPFGPFMLGGFWVAILLQRLPLQ